MCLYLQEVNCAYVLKGDLEANAHSLVEEVGFLKTLYEEVSTSRENITQVSCFPGRPVYRGNRQKRASSRVEAGTSGFVSISDSDRRVPAELGQESHASSCKEEWNYACLSSYSRGDRQLVELCLESAGFSRRCTRVSVPLRVVPSSTGLPLKRCPGIGFLSRADRGIGVFQHVLPPMKLRLKYSR